MYNKICKRCNYKAKTYLSDCPKCGHHLSYDNHCWNCFQDISSDSNKRCPECGWFICNCGACGKHPHCSTGKDRIEEYVEENNSNIRRSGNKKQSLFLRDILGDEEDIEDENRFGSKSRHKGPDKWTDEDWDDFEKDS